MSGPRVSVHIENQYGGTAFAAGQVGHLSIDSLPRQLLLDTGTWTREGTQPSVLLSAAHQVVPFDTVGRTVELTWLRRWADGPARDSVSLITGPGGAGKTRLAIHWCSVCRDNGWDAGFLREKWPIPDEMRMEERPLMVVVDYAETRVAQVDALLSVLARRREGPKVRVLLLARRSGDWWESDLKVRSDAATRGLIEDSLDAVHELSPMALDRARRRAAFHAAHTAFANRLQVTPTGEAVFPDLDDALFGRALYIQIAAYASLFGHRVQSSDDALDFVLTREVASWTREIERSRRLSSNEVTELTGLMLATACAVTLLGGVDSGGGLRRLVDAAVPVDDMFVPDLRRELGSLTRFYGRPGGGLHAVEPDLLGEHLVRRALARQGENALPWLERVLGSGGNDALVSIMTVIGRAAESAPEMRMYVEGLLRRRLPERAMLALEAARWLGAAPETANSPLGQALAVALDGESVDGEINAPFWSNMLDRIPHPSLGLGEVAEVCARRLREALATGGPTDPLQIARAADNHALRLSHLRRWDQALRAAEDAISAYHRVGAAPGAALANCLNNLGSALSGAGRRLEAVDATSLAISIYGHIAEVEPGWTATPLAAALSNLSARLLEVGRHVESLAAAREAVETYRGLAERDPSGVLPALASSLTNLSNALSAHGAREEALETIEEAVSLLRGAAVTQPDAVLPDLAKGIANLGIRLWDLRQYDGAVAVAREAVVRYRRLCELRRDVFLPELARSLMSLGNRLQVRQHLDEALAVMSEALTYYQELVTLQPAVFTGTLAGALNNQGAILLKLGRRDDAVEMLGEAVRRCRSLAAEQPKIFTTDLAMSLNNLGAMLAALGRAEAALAASEEALVLHRIIAADGKDPESEELAMALHNVAIRRSDVGQRAEALPALNEAVDIRRRLVAARPHVHSSDLVASLEALGNLLSDLGRLPAALIALEEAVSMLCRLDLATPGVFEVEVARCLGNLGSTYAAIGRHAEALAVSEEAAARYRKLAKDRPDAYEQELAGTLVNLTSRFANQGRAADALAVGQESVELCRRLTRTWPGAVEPILSAALLNLAPRLLAQGQTREALAAAREATVRYRRLAAAQGRAYQPNLARALGSWGSLLTASGRTAKAVRVLHEGLSILVALPAPVREGLHSIVRLLSADYLRACTDAGHPPDQHLLTATQRLLEENEP